MSHRQLILKETFVKDSNNKINLFLLENGVGIAPTYTQLVVTIGAVALTRTANGTGVSLSTGGNLEIDPGRLTEDLTALVVGTEAMVYVRVSTVSDPDGVVWGDLDSAQRIVFQITDPP